MRSLEPATTKANNSKLSSNVFKFDENGETQHKTSCHQSLGRSVVAEMFNKSKKYRECNFVKAAINLNISALKNSLLI